MMAVTKYEPDMDHVLYSPMFEYAFKLKQALESVGETSDSIGTDDVPIYWEGEVAGYLVLSEVDGVKYDLAFAKATD